MPISYFIGNPMKRSKLSGIFRDENVCNVTVEFKGDPSEGILPMVKSWAVCYRCETWTKTLRSSLPNRKNGGYLNAHRHNLSDALEIANRLVTTLIPILEERYKALLEPK